MSDQPGATKASGKNPFDIVVMVPVMIAFLLLVSNVFVLGIASALNDKACRDAAIEAARACVMSDDDRFVTRAAFNGLSTSGRVGFFMEHPQFTTFKYDKTKEGSVFLVQTATSVKLPAPMLAFSQDVSQDGRVWLHKTYRLTLKND